MLSLGWKKTLPSITHHASILPFLDASIRRTETKLRKTSEKISDEDKKKDQRCFHFPQP
jgi:hypothetical protein